ncbi:MAG: helix-turn-helix transcriptional regulator [Deltaproteobacteria bacterium]|nr:helix-turn-helix transcriptional regulator [Deltaproteobacteria bacterium]
MHTRKLSAAQRYLEEIAGTPLTLASLLWAIRMCDEESQVDFSKRLGISKAHLCDIEKGRKSISPNRAEVFAKLLGYSEEQFVRLALEEQIISLKGHYVMNLEKKVA